LGGLLNNDLVVSHQKKRSTIDADSKVDVLSQNSNTGILFQKSPFSL